MAAAAPPPTTIHPDVLAAATALVDAEMVLDEIGEERKRAKAARDQLAVIALEQLQKWKITGSVGLPQGFSCALKEKLTGAGANAKTLKAVVEYIKERGGGKIDPEALTKSVTAGFVAAKKKEVAVVVVRPKGRPSSGPGPAPPGAKRPRTA